MKELSIEEKAKRYDKALGRAEDALNDGTISNNTIAYLQDIFPELKESEDEKIRKVLIRFHKSTIDIDGIKGNEIVSWLERQGEQNLIMAKSPQLGEQKPAWSEEDEEYLRRAINATKDTYPMTAKWLKSLKDRYTWKPSDEQMKALSIAMCGVNDPLFSLYQDLLKLKDEK